MAEPMPFSREQVNLPDAQNEAVVTRCTSLALVLILLFAAWPGAFVTAQAEPRDYTISTPLVSYSADGAQAVVSFTITNQGGDAPELSQVTIADNRTGQIEKSETLPVLAAGETYAFSTELPLAGYPEGDIFLQVEVGIDQYELAGSPIARDNSQLFRINVADARLGIGSQPDQSQQPSAGPRYDVWIPIINLGIDFVSGGIRINDNLVASAQIVLALVLVALALFLLWIAILILRLVFRRPPAFETWQAPYTINSYHDPDSTEGRRQSWQFQAQNSAILAHPVADQVAVVKRLVDQQGRVLGAWMIMAVRTTQYDIYGRINRTEVIMPYSVIKQLNQLAQRAPELDNQHVNNTLQAIAKRMSRAATAAIEKQNRMLPIAMEIRFDGAPGAGRIIFELYQCRTGAWHLVDSWEPELVNTGSRIPEYFSYTLNGMLPGETYREFKSRLPQELTQLLGGLFYHHQAATEPESPSLTSASPLGTGGDDETDESLSNGA